MLFNFYHTLAAYSIYAISFKYNKPIINFIDKIFISNTLRNTICISKLFTKQKPNQVHYWNYNLHYIFKVCFTIILGAILSTQIAHAKNARIGLSLPLSGTAKKLGEQFLIGARIAIQHHINDTIELEVLDDGCKKDLGELVATEFSTSNIDIVTGFLCNEPSYAAANILRDSKTPILIAGAQSERLTKDREREEWNIWRLSPGDNAAAIAAAKELSKLWINSPFAIVDDGTVHGRTLVDAFRLQMADLGLSPHFTDTFRPTQSTQARLVRRLKKAGIRKVFIGGGAEDIAMIARNASDLKIKLDIAGSEVLSVLPFLPNKQRAPNGVTAILRNDAQLLISSKVLSDALIAQDIIPEDFMYRGYAAMQVAIEAIGESKQDTISSLNAKTFKTINGNVKFSNNGENTISPYALFTWNGDVFIKNGSIQ